MTTPDPAIEFRIVKLIEYARRRGGALSESEAREHVEIELIPNPTAAQTTRRREIIAHALGKCKCGQCHPNQRRYL